ncbi:sensor histidine kinase [Acidovorax sp. LjRoot194]|uniref:sensor histidine kinase n=1 Tax=Acidovorax sp. LjRoot194 TaxID=3342280 RepID=UPI0009EBB5F5
MHENSRILTTHIPHPAATFGARGLRLWLVMGWLFFSALFSHANAVAQDFQWQLGWDLPMDRLDDPDHRLGPDDVATAQAQAGVARLRHSLSAGYLSHPVWLRFDVPALPPGTDPGALWLLAQPTYLDSITLYQRSASGDWSAQISGDHVPSAHKSGVRQHLFRLAPGATALIRIETTSAMQLQGSILGTQALATALARSERVMGLYFGAMAALLLAVWAAAAIFRTRSLMALAVLGTVSFIHIFNVRGYSSLWAPAALTQMASHAVGIGAFMLAATLAWQVRQQLSRTSRYRRTDKLLIGLVALNLAGSLSVPLGFYGSVAWVNLLSLITSDLIAIALCVLALRRREKRALHTLLLAAYGLHAVAGVPITIIMTGALHWNIDATALWQAEIIVFTLLIACAVFVGLVVRYRDIQRVKDLAIARLAQSEQSLEERIEQRTSELSHTQVALGHALDNERELRLEQRQFFHMISHEFRTPLAVVDSAAAEQQAFPSPDLTVQKDRAAQMRRACRRLTSLVDSCLISERLDTAGFTLQASPVRVADLLEHAAQLVHWSPRHRLRLFTESAPEEWVCDETLVRIALSNLVDNAVKYASAGEIFIAARKADSGLLEISVADEGSGMSLEVMNRIFQRFERGDRTDQSKGFGLGLWVTRRVARLHGGDITVESRPGEGACFTLTLGAQRVGPQPDAGRPRADAAHP